MKKQEGTMEAWDTRELGADEQHARAAGSEHSAALDEALGLQSISIRLPKTMIDAYKLIAAHHGVGYQPLMRDILQRFIPEGLREVMEHQQAKASEADNRLDEMRKAA